MASLEDKVFGVIAEHLAQEEGGGFVTGFYLIADYNDAEGRESWLYATAPDQNLSTTLGMLRVANGAAEYELKRYFDDIAED
jgi:hypothetical protein